MLLDENQPFEFYKRDFMKLVEIDEETLNFDKNTIPEKEQVTQQSSGFVRSLTTGIRDVAVGGLLIAASSAIITQSVVKNVASSTVEISKGMNTGITSVKDRIQAKKLEEERLAREQEEQYEKMKKNLLDSKTFKENQKLVSRLNQKIFLKKKELEEI